MGCPFEESGVPGAALAVGVHGNPAAAAPRVTGYPFDFGEFDFADPGNHVAQDGQLPFAVCVLRKVLQVASSAPSIDRAAGLNPPGPWFHDAHDASLGPSAVVGGYHCRYPVADRRERHHDDLSVDTSKTLAEVRRRRYLQFEFG
jgi:hypothetical protein